MKVRSLILAAVVVVAANSAAHTCNEDCRAIFTDPISRRTTEGVDEICVLRKEACQLCARDKVESTGATLECANCVLDTPRDDLRKCIALCGGAAKLQEVFYAAGCL
jgi:hypothetical protein